MEHRGRSGTVFFRVVVACGTQGSGGAHQGEGHDGGQGQPGVGVGPQQHTEQLVGDDGEGFAEGEKILLGQPELDGHPGNEANQAVLETLPAEERH